MILFGNVSREKKKCRRRPAEVTARCRKVGTRLEHSWGLVRAWLITDGERYRASAFLIGESFASSQAWQQPRQDHR